VDHLYRYFGLQNPKAYRGSSVLGHMTPEGEMVVDHKETWGEADGE
jgi:hypothetical protein